MRNIRIALWAEYMKVRRSKILWIIMMLFVFIPSMMSLMFFVQKYPELAGKLGMIGTKANMMRLGNGDWTFYLSLLSQAMAGIGLVGFGFITSWVFGREYTDRTIKDIAALPVSRSAIVTAKFLIITFWSILLIFIFLISAVIIGNVIDIPGWSGEIVIQLILKFIWVSLFTLLLCTPVAFLASYSRGFMLPMGFVILTLIIANFTGLVGLGPYFPWAIPGLCIAQDGNPEMQLHFYSYFIVFATSIIGGLATYLWWKNADLH